MKHSQALVAGVLLTSSVVSAQASPEAVEGILAAANNSQVEAHLDHLVNRLGPRLTSSDNLTNA